MKAADIIRFLEQWAPPVLQESYDNSGLIVGDSSTEVTGIMVSLDCTEDVVEDALARGCNMVVSHHPIVFSGLKRLNGKNYVERTVMKAVRHDVLLYAIHTNLDHVPDGVNGRIAQRLGLTNTAILAPKMQMLRKLVVFVPHAHAEAVRNAMFEAGAGHIGNYDRCSFNLQGEGSFRGNEHSSGFVGKKGETHFEPETRIEVILPAHLLGKVTAAMRVAHPYEEVAHDIYALENSNQTVGAGLIGDLTEEMDALGFLKQLKTNMGTACVRHTLPHRHKVKRIAVCGGAGSFLLPMAIAQGADVLVTADFKYHQFFDADNRIIIADIGHFESEQFTVQLLAERLTDNFPTFATHLTRVRTNPVHYL
jgi:dinuclear metal center YbgI/SA1388 family protein